MVLFGNTREERYLLEQYLIGENHVDVINPSRTNQEVVGIYKDEQVRLIPADANRKRVLSHLKYHIDLLHCEVLSSSSSFSLSLCSFRFS